MVFKSETKINLRSFSDIYELPVKCLIFLILLMWLLLISIMKIFPHILLLLMNIEWRIITLLLCFVLKQINSEYGVEKGSF